MRALALALALALVGCVEPPSPEELPGQVPPLPTTLWLTGLMTLDAAPDANETTVPAAPFFQTWQSGDDYPTWAADPPRGDFLVTALNLTLVMRATGPVVQSQRFADVSVYAGAGDAWMGYADHREGKPLVPGETYRLRLSLTLPPEGGLWVSPEAALALKVVPLLLQQDGAHLEVIVGGEDGSRLDLESRRIDVPRQSETRGAAQGELAGTIYAGEAAPETTRARIPLHLPAGTPYLLVWMNTTQAEGVPDLDLALETPEGRALAASGTPTPREALRVVQANLLGGGEHVLVVTTAGAPRATYRVEWSVGEG